MKKSILSSLVVVAAATLSVSAMALDIDKGKNTWAVSVDIGGELADAGTMRCDFPWPDYSEDAFGYPATFCAYDCDLRREGDWLDITNIFLWEKHTSGHKDCDKNAKEAFLTRLVNDPDRRSNIFVRWDKKKIGVLAVGESTENDLYGTLTLREHGYSNYGVQFISEGADGGDDHEDDEEDDEEEGADTEETSPGT
ncbi:hypothetical protein [Sorangium sp. So ce341]|uniref:hypothetical protein n=1 Tax=Sorangium sp. So ce341 TaxID=3133302 RepID=UPI003F634952